MGIPFGRTNEGFVFFPYSPDVENGRTNNGGIDLLQNPERIEEITELANLPRAKAVIKKLIGADSLFMTLGFEAGPLNGAFCGYLEFAFRDGALARKENSYKHLIELMSGWFQRVYPHVAAAAFASLVAEVKSFYYHGVFHGDRITVWFRAVNRDAAEDLIDLVGQFLLEKYPSELAS